MIMKRFLSIILFLFFSITLIAAGTVDFSDKEKAIIYTNSLKILQDYEIIINEIGVNVVNDIEKAQSNAEGLIELFINRQVLVFNDLDPSYRLSKFYEAETYSANLILWYPDGVSINMDFENAKVGNIMQHEDNVYSLDIMLNKKIDGNYLNQTLNRNTEGLTFRIAFSGKNRSFDNFKIVGIRNAESSDIIDYSKALKEVNSEELNEEELTKIHEGIKALLGDYNNFLALLGDPDEVEEDKVFYKESFTNIFENSETKIYNDINPEPEKSLINVSSYITQYAENFPDGIKNISVNIDSADFGKVIKSEEGSFFTYTYADKFFSGSFKGKEAFSEMFPLAFKISFEKSGKAYSNYKISGIDISGSGFFSESASDQVIAVPDMVIKPVTRKGLLVALSGSYGLSYIKDQNISAFTMESDNYKWNINNGYGLTAGIRMQYFFTDFLGIETGVYYDTYKSMFNLEGNFQNDDFSTDINDDSFFKIFNTAIDSAININYITVPLLLNYISSKPGKIGFYINAGVKASYAISSSYSISGNYKYSGYYPSNPLAIQYLEISELGFYNRENIDETGDTEISSLNLSLYGSVGIYIPFGYYSSVYLGPDIIYGFTDIMGGRSEYKDIFGNLTDNQPVKIQKIGLKIGFVYQF